MAKNSNQNYKNFRKEQQNTTSVNNINSLKKELYISHTPQIIPIFHKPFFLDVVTNNSWDVCIIEKDNEIIASLPYFFRKYKGIVFFDQPPLTQFLGPWIKPEIFQNISYKKYHEIIEKLYDMLPEFGCCNHHWHFTYQNWLPLYWKGYEQTTRYTYIIPFEEQLDKAWNKINYTSRREILKSQPKYSINSINDFDKFFELVKQNFVIKNKNNPYNYSLFAELDKACSLNNSRQILAAYDKTKNIHGMLYLLYDSNTMYYFAGGCDKQGFDDEVIKLLIWEAIKIANEKHLIFDFEGSMMKNVEFFFSSFGSIQKPYFAVSKINSKKLILNNFFKKILKNNI